MITSAIARYFMGEESLMDRIGFSDKEAIP